MRRALILLSVLALALSLVAARPADEQQVRAPAPDVDPVEEVADEADPAASGFTVFKLPLPQPACSGVAFGITQNPYFTGDDCGFVDFNVTGSTDTPQVVIFGPDGTTVEEQTARRNLDDTAWRFDVVPTGDWPAGEFVAEVMLGGAPAGSTTFLVNGLGADVSVAAPDGSAYAAGDDLVVSGRTYQLDATSDAVGAQQTDVPATFVLQVAMPDGTVVGGTEPVTAAADGTFTATVPGSATEAVAAPPGTAIQVAVRVADATHEDPVTGSWAAAVAGTGDATFAAPADTLALEHRFASSTGWVKPGDPYPSRVVVRNATGAAVTGASVTVVAPPGTAFTSAEDLTGAGTVEVTPDTITWTIPEVAAGDAVAPTELPLVIMSRAATTDTDPQVVWKDLSAAATLSVTGGEVATASSHGPKVIPPDGGFETARYGDKPFPIVPVEYADRSRQSFSTAEGLDRAVNAPDFPGSTFNLYQEMSYGQLFPQGAIPSAGTAHADFEYEHGFDFTDPEVGTNRDCRGFTFGQDGVEEAAVGSPVYPDRIVDGWYQLPGTTEYYGGDFPAFALGVVGTIDSACGQLGKGVYDAAQIADPEIDYDEFDSDKDGVVDFFMLVFNGCGGNGASQVPSLCPYGPEPYDNIWPHSSSLEMQYTDPATGLRGYVSDDQLTSHTGVPQCWINEQYLEFDDCAANGGTGRDDLPTHVRVGPYNVNPETAIQSASVISHEYGHHLGLPDFYSSYDAYGDFNLMATDYSQHMTIFGKQELGWVVPQPIQPGDQLEVTDWEEIKTDIGEIHWKQPDGTPYTLSAPEDQNIHNGQAYRAGLEPRILLDAASRPEGDEHVWYSGRGNDFGCAPAGAHNLDVHLQELTQRDPETGELLIPEGSTVTLEFSSSWDIEWDWDYGFLLTSPDGANFTSQPSEQGYSTSNVFNPNSQQCFTELDNGLTGTSTAYQQGEPFVTAARNPAEPEYTSEDDPFLTDTYDISELVGAQTPLVRFSYFTDAAFDRPGWFVDNIRVTATTPDGQVIEVYASDFEEDDEDTRLFPGGCGVAAACTDGWTRIAAGGEAAMDHAYYLELRDQTGFDYDGHGQSDRGDTSWDPGLLIEYTDEAHGYGNNGVPLPPAQHYLDSQPIPGEDCEIESPLILPAPELNCADASFTDADDDSTFSDAITEDNPGGWIDNFEDPNNEYDDDFWHFDHGCLTAEVGQMEGEDIGPAPTADDPLPQDLTANVTLTGGTGCQPFTFGQAGDEDPVENTPPTAVATATPTEAAVDETVTFDGSGSTDTEDQEELTYAWDFGDGATATGATVEHAYSEADTYKATLTVTDPDGASAADTVTVTVTEQEPPEPVRIECDDPAVERSAGWTDEESEDATDGRYCQGKGPRGSNAGDHLEVAFTGTSITLEHGVAPNGGTATVTIDGVEAGVVSFHGDGEGNDPMFGHEVTFDDLGEGDHTFHLEVTEADGRQRFAYVDSLVADGFASTGSESTSDGAEVGAAGRTAQARAAGSSTPVGTMALAVLLVALTMALHLRRLAAGSR